MTHSDKRTLIDKIIHTSSEVIDDYMTRFINKMETIDFTIYERTGTRIITPSWFETGSLYRFEAQEDASSPLRAPRFAIDKACNLHTTHCPMRLDWRVLNCNKFTALILNHEESSQPTLKFFVCESSFNGMNKLQITRCRCFWTSKITVDKVT